MDANDGFATFDVERELERDGAWLLRAALALTNDPGTAEDAAQATWIHAWRRRSATGRGASRGWLMQVLRNSVRGQLRDGARRSVREREAAVPEGFSPGDPVQRIELQRITLDAIESLDEPYRSTIVERFLDGHSIEDIARRTGTPRKTVETWSRRGILRLRAALEGRRDSKGVAVLALLKETAQRSEPAVIACASTGAGLGPWGMASIASLLGLAAAGALVLLWHSSPTDGRDTPEVAHVASPRGVELHELGLQSGDSSRLGARSEGSGSALPAAGANPVAFAQVVSLDGTPMAGVEITTVAPSELAEPSSRGPHTDALGRATFPSPRPGAAARLVTVQSHEPLSAVLRPRLDSGVIARVVVAAQMAREVRVVDSAGAAIQGARVRANVDTDRLEEFGTGDGVESVPRWSVTTDAAGDAAIAAFPRHELVEMEFAAPGFESVTCPSEELPSVVSLRRVTNRGVVGRVLDPLGVPVPNAWVGVGELLVRTGPGGRFLIPQAPRGGVIRAVAEGFQPVRSPLSDERSSLKLQLERRTESLPIMVDGAPPGNLLVVLRGEEPFGLASREFAASILHAEVSAEALGAGRHAKRIEPLVLGEDARRATIGGLLSRPYQLFLVSVERAEVIAALEVVPTSTELRVSSGKLEAVCSVTGRVVSTTGRPIPGAEVRIAPRSVEVPHKLLSRAVTDGEGFFRFEGIGGPGWTVFVLRRPGETLAATIEVESARSQELLQVELPDLRHARIQVDDSSLVDARLSLLDEGHRVVPMISRVGDSTFRCQSLTLGDGRTGVLEFSDRAVWARLEIGTAELLRKLPTREPLPGGGVEVIRLD